MTICIILMVACLMCKFVVLENRDIHFWYALIPGYNKYILGKLADSKVLGIINAILFPLLVISYICYLSMNIYICSQYSDSITADSMSTLEVTVPVDVANSTNLFGRITVILFIITLITYMIMMYKFTKKNEADYKIMRFLWFMPIIPYIYFALNHKVYIPEKGIFEYSKKQIEAYVAPVTKNGKKHLFKKK